MCRSGNESAGTTPRRCACDTSEKRNLRRKNAQLVAKYKHLEHEPEPIQTPEPMNTGEITVEERIQRTQQLLETLTKYGNLYTYDTYRSITETHYEEVTETLTAIGEEIAHIAAEKYGAIRDEEWAEQWDKYKQLLTEEKELAKLETEAYREFIKVDKDEEPEKREELRIKLQEAGEQQRQKQEEARLTQPSLLHEKQGEAYKKALQDIGVEYDENILINAHTKSKKEAVKVLQQAIQYYPAHFVETSNTTPILVQEHLKNENPHYQSHHPLEEAVTYKYVDTIYEVAPDPNKPINYETDKVSRNDLGWVELPVSRGDVYYKHADSDYTTSRSIESTGRHSATTWWAKLPTEQKVQEKKPAGERWQEATLNTGEKVWWRTRIRTRKRGDKIVGTVPRIVIGKPYYNSTEATAIHEFAHRVEDKIPFVQAAENAFLKTRTKDEKEVTSIQNTYRDAVGYRDHFVDHYIGRVYPGGATEILSTGMEAIFKGEMGGLMGTSQDHPDADTHHRNFVLGVLASSVTLKKYAPKPETADS